MPVRRVLITGASKGIGRAVAGRVARVGNVPVGLARTAPVDFPGEFVTVDLSDVPATAAALESVVATGRVDAVVNNFGYARWGALGQIDLDDLMPTYDLNVRVAVQVTQAALPGMLAGNWGRIVNVTSLVTLGTGRRTPYAAAKAALEAATRIWAGEAGAVEHHGECCRARTDGDRVVSDPQPDRVCGRGRFVAHHTDAPAGHPGRGRACDLFIA